VQTFKELAESNQANQPIEPKQYEFPICKSSWITHLIQQEHQCYSSVRDYIVPGERIGSLLKENSISIKDKAKFNQKYLLRIRTQLPKEALA
jgi:hypothetical protein